ncbi:MAG: hypothetical protein R3C17_18510 [Planctomycetaceae bacterium]
MTVSTLKSASKADSFVAAKRICYLVSHGFAARMVLQSSLMHETERRGIQTTVLCPQGVDQDLRRYERPGVLDFESGEFEVSKLTHGQISELQRYFREPITNNPALWSRHLYNRNSAKGWIRWRADLFLLIHRLCYGSKTVSKLVTRLDRRIHRSPAIAEQLRRLQPDLVVSTYPVAAFESTCLLEAQHLGIRTVGHLLSWDNITCKGRFIAPPDDYISWGPIMTEELQEHYQVAREQIFECGVPHFDAHLQLVDRQQLESILVEQGIKPDRPYLFFGMSSPVFAPHEIDIVEHLARQVEAGEYGSDMQLVIRPHPQNVTGFMADMNWLPRLEGLRSERVAVNLPLLAEGRLAWNMEQSDLGILVNLLAGCTVCLNSGSTLSIDALMHQKPVVLTFFDADEELPWWKSARRIAEFPHYRKLLATRGVQPVGSFSEMTQTIHALLATPDRGAADRKHALMRECGSTDGMSAARVADALLEIMRGSTSHSDTLLTGDSR